jgi:hypothetical protein
MTKVSFSNGYFGFRDGWKVNQKAGTGSEAVHWGTVKWFTATKSGVQTTAAADKEKTSSAAAVVSSKR